MKGFTLIEFLICVTVAITLAAFIIPSIVDQPSREIEDRPIETVLVEQGNFHWQANTFCANGVTYFEKHRGAVPLFNRDGTLIPCDMVSEQ